MPVNYPTREDIRSLCTEQSFERGVNYWRQGRILELDVDGPRIEATVRGSHDYTVSIHVDEDAVRPRCSCPYDYAGECKHVVAVLLAVDDRETDAGSERSEAPPDTVDVDALIAETPADELRSFLRDAVADDRDLRDRFVAFAGEETGKTVHDYKREIDRLFDDAAGRGGLIDYDTWIDFSQYHDLAETHRERGRVDAATDVYRALAETIRENFGRVDDSSGHYGRELERAVESYAEAVAEADLDHEEKRQYVDYLFEEFVGADYHFASEDYADALRTVCTSRADLEYWLDRLDDVVDVSLDPSAIEGGTREPDSRTRDRDDDVLYASEFTDGPLDVDEFTGGTIDVEHLAVGPLEPGYFLGDAFDELRVDEPTTIEEHTVDTGSTGSDATGEGIASSLRTRNVLSMAIYLLEELGEDVSGLYEEAYLEDSRFCEQYAERLIDRGEEARAIEVLENGVETFRSPSSLRRRLADLYREGDPAKYRETLKRLFLDHGEWDAYDELKAACEDEEWDSIYAEFERQFETDDRRRLLDLYVHEGDLEAAFDELTAAENLSWFRRYRDPVASVDPIAYFEAYREQLLPFAAGETGRRHYRDVIDHLEEMEELVPAGRFEEFLEFLKEKHDNRPAFLDELEKAGF